MAETMRLLVDHLRTPIGELLIVSDENRRLRAVDWHDFEDRMLRKLTTSCAPHDIVLVRARNPFGQTTAFSAYMNGDITALDRLEVEAVGTPFQRTVWQALREITAGTTASYRGLAERIGRPSAVRAVGLANAANPVGIVVPCHRVIGADGSLTGYGGGLARKQWLLAHEARHAERLSDAIREAG